MLKQLKNIIQEMKEQDVRQALLAYLYGVLPTKRRYYTLSNFQPEKVEFLYAKESTF